MSVGTVQRFVTTLMLSLVMTVSVHAQSTQCDPYWTGSWDTNFGQLRLIEDGDMVYGDYADVGTIKAYLNRPCGEYLRGTFERNDGGWGYIEFVATGDLGSRFSGRWSWHDGQLPSWRHKSGGEWKGTIDDRFPPPILNFKPGETRDPLAKTPWPFHKWMTLVDIKAEDKARQETINAQKAEQERVRANAAEYKRKEEEKKRAAEEAARKLEPVSSGLAVNDGYASILSVDSAFNHNKAKTAASMQHHVQMISEGDSATVKKRLKDNGFTLIGDGVYESGGLSGERLRMTIVRKGPAIIVTFRGTGGETAGQTIVNAIASDARTKLISPSFISSSRLTREKEKGLLVHKGFYESYMHFRPTLQKLLAEEPKSNLFVFGHSLGGAMATLMAIDMQTNYSHRFETITHLVSGSPRVGNEAFFEYFTYRVHDNLRIVVNNDPVPVIPGKGRVEGSAKFQDYVHVGRLLVTEEDGKPLNGDHINVKKPLRLLHNFTTYHDNKVYKNAVRLFRDKMPSNATLMNNGSFWVTDTGRKERARSK